VKRNKNSTLSNDPLWYKDAIIYQIHIKSFFDANNDGIGDFPGLLAKLDYISELGVLDHGILYELYEATRDVGLVASVHHDDPEWCKRLTFRDYIDKGRNDAMSYQESFSKGYMYGHGMVAGLASSLYYARVAGVRLHVLHLGVMPPGANEMIRHAKFELGQDVTSELELGTLFMTKEQMEKVGPYTYNWGYAPEHGWKAIENGVADFIVLEHAPHTREDVEPGWKDMFSVPLGMTGAQEFIPLMINAVNEGKLTLNQVAQKAAEAPARTFGIYPKKGVIQVGSDADFTILDMTREGEFRHEDMLTKSAHTSWVGMRTKGAATYGIVRGTVVMQDGKVVGAPGYGKFTPGTAAATAPAPALRPSIAAPKSASVPAGNPSAGHQGVHVVAAGETLTKISRLYGKPIHEIAKANNILAGAKLNVGDRLVIPGVRTSALKPNAIPIKPVPAVAQAKPAPPRHPPPATTGNTLR